MPSGPLHLALGIEECQGGGQVLDDRKLAVLRAIVEDYVSTNEPVGSKSIVDRHNLDVSPATIRNDMAVLEEQGFTPPSRSTNRRYPLSVGIRPARRSWPAPTISMTSSCARC